MRIVAPEYYCALDAGLLRLDHLQRPELNKGTVDFAVPDEYWAPHPPPAIRPLYYSMSPDPSTSRRKPAAMDYVFAFDVSQEAVRLGFLHIACNVLLELLYGRDDVLPCFPPSSRISILAYDRTLQFYNLSVSLFHESLYGLVAQCIFLSVRNCWATAYAGRPRCRRCLFTLNCRVVRRSRRITVCSSLILDVTD